MKPLPTRIQAASFSGPGLLPVTPHLTGWVAREVEGRMARRRGLHTSAKDSAKGGRDSMVVASASDTDHCHSGAMSLPAANQVITPYASGPHALMYCLWATSGCVLTRGTHPGRKSPLFHGPAEVKSSYEQRAISTLAELKSRCCTPTVPTRAP
mgnify:CR=1 FL=1